MNRHVMREQAFKLLFECEFHEIPEMEHQCAVYFDTLGEPKDLAELRLEMYRKDKLRHTKALVQELNELEKQEMELIEKARPDQEMVIAKVEAILSLIPELDAVLNEKTEGWDTERLGKVELTILRLALYEIKYEEDLDVAVSINEAVELAKTYGPEDSPAFINAVLSKIVNA